MAEAIPTEESKKRSHEDENEETTLNDADADVDGDKPKRKRKRKRKNKENEGGESKSEHDSTEAKLSSLHHTVYVEGIPFDCSEEDVKEFFISNGCDGIIQLRLPR
jgi:RNA recognition motif-containing protein